MTGGPAAGASVTERAWAVVADATGIGLASAVLDVGCGAGGFCRLAAGRGAVVHGIDADSAQVAAARRLVPAGDVRLGFMEELPWPDDHFDVVTGFNAFQYALDAELALREARRVSRPEGTIAVCKWGPPEDNEFFAFLAELGAVTGRLPAADPVEAAMARVGLDVVDAGAVPAAIELADDAALEAALVNVGALHGDDRRPRMLAAAERYRGPAGGYRFRNRLVYRLARA